MSAFYQILDDLIIADRATCAIFVDDSGETVDLAMASSAEDAEEMRLLAAYAGIYLRQTSRFCAAEKVGTVSNVSVACEGLHVHALRLREGYSLIVISRQARLDAVSRRRFEATAVKIELEAFGAIASEA